MRRGRGVKSGCRVDPRADQILHDLAALMAKDDVSMDRLSEMTGITRSNIQKWFSGITGARWANMKACFNALGYPLVLGERFSEVPGQKTDTFKDEFFK